MTEVQYITDAKGQRTGVILSIEEYESIILNSIEEVDDPELVEAMDEANDSPTVTRAEVFALLERDS